MPTRSDLRIELAIAIVGVVAIGLAILATIQLGWVEPSQLSGSNLALALLTGFFASIGAVFVTLLRMRMASKKTEIEKPEIVIEQAKLTSGETPKELIVRLRRGGEARNPARFHFIKIKRIRGSVNDLRGSFVLNGGTRMPLKLFTCPLKETWTVTQIPEIDVVPTKENVEEFAIQFLNDEKWGHDTLSLNESTPEHTVLLLFSLKYTAWAYIPSDTRRYLMGRNSHRLDMYLEGTGVPLYKAASFGIDAREWSYDPKLLSADESQVPHITVTPADADSKKLKEIHVILSDGVLVYPARFYFVTMKNLTGPTINDLEVRFRATHGGGEGSILMIPSTGKDYRTIRKEDDTMREFRSRKDALRDALDPAYIHSAERTVLHKGDLGKTFAIAYTNEGVDGVSFPTLDSRPRVFFYQAKEGFRLDLFVCGDTLPTTRVASFKVSADSVTSLKVEPIHEEPPRDSDSRTL